MPSERIQRCIDSFLDRPFEEAVDSLEWAVVAETARAVLAIEATNEDAAAFLSMAVANGVAEATAPEPARRPPPARPPSPPSSPPTLSSRPSKSSSNSKPPVRSSPVAELCSTSIR